MSGRGFNDLASRFISFSSITTPVTLLPVYAVSASRPTTFIPSRLPALRAAVEKPTPGGQRDGRWASSKYNGSSKTTFVTPPASRIGEKIGSSAHLFLQ